MSDIINKMPPKVLVMDNDRENVDLIARGIQSYWFEVVRANNPDEAMRSIRLYNIHLAVIGMRPSNPEDAAATEETVKVLHHLIRDIRSVEGYEKLPFVVMLPDISKETLFSDIQNGLIQCIETPCIHEALMQYIKELLRQSEPVLSDRILKYKDVSIDLGSYKVFRQDKEVQVGPTEFKILNLLMQDPKRIFSREEILDYAWGVGCSNIDPRTVDVHMNRLRSSLKKISDRPVIHTVRSSGYCLSLPGEPD